MRILVVDEAQYAPAGILEEIHWMTKLEDAKGQLLRVELAGRPELNVLLESYELRQLKQRIAVRVHLHPLSEAETHAYVQHRLGLSGNSAGQIFSHPAIHRVFKFSGRIPRLINTLCDNALVRHSTGRLWCRR
jgi:general secretion pathway protein A